jgi:hypothetical protein
MVLLILTSRYTEDMQYKVLKIKGPGFVSLAASLLALIKLS